MFHFWLVCLLVVTAAACPTEPVYNDCVADHTCREALWHPTRAQFDRFVLHLPLNCSAPSPALDLAARVRTTYLCPPGFYGNVDAVGTLRCECPTGQVCGVPSTQNLVIGLLFGLVLIGGAVFLRAHNSIKS